MSLISNLIDTFLEWLNEWTLERCKERRLVLDSESLETEAREWVNDVYCATRYMDIEDCEFEEIEEVIANHYPGGFTAFCKAEAERLRQYDRDLKAAREDQYANAEVQ